MSKKLISIRASAETLRQLAELAAKFDTTQSEVITIAVERLYHERIREVQPPSKSDGTP